MAMRILGLGCLAAVGTAATCDSNVGDGDRRPQETVRLSVRADGKEGKGSCDNAFISADGRYVVFESVADDLVVPDGNGYRDIILKDRATGALENVTRVPPSVIYAVGIPFTVFLSHAFDPAVSRDGRFVAFRSKGAFQGPSSIPGGPNPTYNVYVFDRVLKTFRSAVDRLVFTFPDHDITDYSMSADGRYIAFSSGAGNLGYANPGFIPQVYVADMSFTPPILQLVSRGVGSPTEISNGSGAGRGRISADGTRIVFASGSTNLGAANGSSHIYLGTPAGDPVELVTVLPGGAPATGMHGIPAVSGDGRYVAFYTWSTDILGLGPGTHVLLRDRGISGVPSSVQVAFDDPWVQTNPPMLPSGEPISISEDGRMIAYANPDTINQIRVWNMQGGISTVSISATGEPGDLSSRLPVMSGDGRWVVWHSDAFNLVVGDGNLTRDIFLRGPLR